MTEPEKCRGKILRLINEQYVVQRPVFNHWLKRLLAGSGKRFLPTESGLRGAKVEIVRLVSPTEFMIHSISFSRAGRAPRVDNTEVLPIGLLIGLIEVEVPDQAPVKSFRLPLLEMSCGWCVKDIRRTTTRSALTGGHSEPLPRIHDRLRPVMTGVGQTGTRQPRNSDESDGYDRENGRRRSEDEAP